MSNSGRCRNNLRMRDRMFEDIHDMDPLVKPICILLTENGYPTISSCQGHPYDGTITFLYDKIPEWADYLMSNMVKFCKENELCMGCVRFRVEYHMYSDCSHALSKDWLIRLQLRWDYDINDATKDNELVWKETYRILQEFFANT